MTSEAIRTDLEDTPSLFINQPRNPLDSTPPRKSSNSGFSDTPEFISLFTYLMLKDEKELTECCLARPFGVALHLLFLGLYLLFLVRTCSSIDWFMGVM
jgi:hypothetical protein